MMTRNPKDNLSPIDSHHHNRSTSSLVSDAATFHSAVAAPVTEMEASIHAQPVTCPAPPPLEHIATQMARTDSGYDAGGMQVRDKDRDIDQRRSASISSSQRSRRNRHSVSSTTSSTHTHTRPTAKRASRSTPTSSIHRFSTRSARPGLQARYTTPHPRTPLLAFDNGDGNAIPTYTFFQFPQFPSVGNTPPSTACIDPVNDAHDENQEISTPPPPPPATIHYFLLPETRRLEYAAIDAASRGVRGFVTKMIPDCILPVEYRRRKFCSGDADSDVGSVRRYRIPLTGEKPGDEADDRATPEAGTRKRPGLWKRLTGLGKA